MEKLFSAISGQFGRSILIGALLPATLFVVAVYLFVLPMVPWESHLAARLEVLEPQWRLVAGFVYAVILAGLLHIFNIPIIRFYEGYPWQNGLIGRWRCRRQRAKANAVSGRVETARELRTAVPKSQTGLRDELRIVRDEARRRRFFEYPDPEYVLPTRLGNVIRSFEMYSQRQYGISAIPLWPRFAVRLRTEHAQMIDDAKTFFDVTIHLSFLAAVTAALLVVAACFFPTPFLTFDLFWPWGVRVGISVWVAWFFYNGSLSRAMEWGDLVRSAFDLHRGDVLAGLGFEPPPGDLESERAVWTEISRRFDFGEPLTERKLRFDLRTIVLPVDSPVMLTRAAGPPNAAGIRTVAIRVYNPQSRPADGVKIVEHVTNGMELLWGTASVSFTGTNPYHFQVPQIAAKGEVVISYQVLAKKPS
jgi:hypothetical protein